MRVLFVCHYNRKRSATAERIFGKDPSLDVRSAGTSIEAMVQVNERMLDWADVVLTMEQDQQREMSRMFPGHAGLKKIVCLEIRDIYDFLDPELVRLLRERAAPHLMRPKEG